MQLNICNVCMQLCNLTTVMPYQTLSNDETVYLANPDTLFQFSIYVIVFFHFSSGSLAVGYVGHK